MYPVVFAIREHGVYTQWFSHYIEYRTQDCTHCNKSFKNNRTHATPKSVCPDSPEIQRKILGHFLQQQERLHKYTPSENDVLLQTKLQRSKQVRMKAIQNRLAMISWKFQSEIILLLSGS